MPRLLVSGDRYLYSLALAAWLVRLEAFKETGAVELDEAVYAVKEQEPEALVLAGNSLTESIRNVIQTTREIADRTAVVLILDEVDQSVVQEVLSLGAGGCISPTSQPEVLGNAVENALRGHFTLGPKVVEALEREKRALSLELSDAELRLLELIADGLDNAELSRRLCVSESTLRRMSCRVVNKLGMSNRTQAAVYAARQGLI